VLFEWVSATPIKSLTELVANVLPLALIVAQLRKRIQGTGLSEDAWQHYVKCSQGPLESTEISNKYVKERISIRLASIRYSA